MNDGDMNDGDIRQPSDHPEPEEGERLRQMLTRRGERIRSGLTISDVRDAGLRVHRHRTRAFAPVLVAASVVVVVVVIALTGRHGVPGTPPAGPGRTGSSSVTDGSLRPTATVSAQSRMVLSGPGRPSSTTRAGS